MKSDIREEYEVRPIKSAAELQKLAHLFMQVFEIQNYPKADLQYLQKLYQEKYFFAFAAIVNDHIIGGLTGYLLPSYVSPKPVAYIYDLAVLPPYQKKGVGKKIINYTKKYCEKMNVKELFVHTHEEKKLINFYRSTYPDEEESVRIFSYQCS